MYFVVFISWYTITSFLELLKQALTQESKKTCTTWISSTRFYFQNCHHGFWLSYSNSLVSLLKMILCSWSI